MIDMGVGGVGGGEGGGGGGRGGIAELVGLQLYLLA